MKYIEKGILILMLMISSNVQGKEDKKSRFENLELFNKVLFLIEKSYYREVNSEKLIEGALKGMMETLDPHSAYLSPKSFTQMKNSTEGEFGGLGIEVTSKDGYIYIISPIDDTPAFRAGLKSGDKIVEINGETTLGMTLNEAIERIKGEIGSAVNLGISRKGVEGIKSYKVERQIVKVKPVKYDMLAGNIGYIRLTQFTKKATPSLVSALKDLKKRIKKEKLKGVVLDLRSNPGGLLTEAVNIASVFLEDGIVVSTEGRNSKKNIRHVNKKIYKDLETPLAVLINGASASASEIVAGALKDHKRALILGSTSFGKGSVQQIASVNDKAGVKLTVSQYMTPSGKKIQAIGIKPDVELIDIDMDVIEQNKNEDAYIREIDLKNHLVSFKETEEEKKLREKKEKEMRARRIAALRKKSNDKSEKEQMRRFDPHQDYQVFMASNYLKAFKSFKEVSLTGQK